MAARTKRSHPTCEPTRAVVEQAAAWQAWAGDVDRNPAEQADLDIWLAKDPSHRIAFDRMGAIAGRVVRHDPIERAALRTMLSRPGRRVGLGALLLLGSVTVSGWWAVDNPAFRSHVAGERSGIGMMRPVNMATGDQITLNSDSAADVDNGQRAIHLWHGGLFARVKHGVERSFVVHTPQGTARAMGTEFTVHIEGNTTIVAVIGSRVEACAGAARLRCVILGAGQAARLDGRSVAMLPNIDPATEAAWLDKLLIADDMPLVTVIERLNRYREQPIRYRSSDLAGLNVSGTFPVNDADRALVSIAAALPVTVDVGTNGIIVTRRTK